jgi:signal transduction histidine kinase
MAELVPEVSAYAVLTALSATVTGLLAVWLYRQYAANAESEPAVTNRYPDLVRPFLAMLVTFTISALGYALAIVDGPTDLGFGVAMIFIVAVPWSVFALRYAGREYLVTRFRIALFSAVVLVAGVVLAISELPGFSSEAIPESVQLTNQFLLLGIIAVVFVVSGLVLLSSYRHGSLTLASGAVVVLPVAELLFAGQLTNPRVPAFSAMILTGSHVAFAVTVVTSVTRYSVLSVRPGTGTLGERRVVEKMDEAVFVVGRRGDIARANDTATQLFGTSSEGDRFADVLGCPVTELSEQDRIRRWTERGRLRFDPRISTLTDSQDRTLGHTVTLLDVTESEIRRQRIEVLNRILRHNLRNKIDIIRARTEAAADTIQTADTHFEKIFDATDDIEGLSVDARRIEKLITDSATSMTTIDLEGTVEAVVEDVTETPRERATVTIEVPQVPVRTNRELFDFALGNIVENALEHNDSPDPQVEIRGEVSETGIRIEVGDNGPGIPDSEQDVFESGSEKPLAHATGLGLWGSKWAVETLGGDLSLGDSSLGGASVCINLPGSEASDS